MLRKIRQSLWLVPAISLVLVCSGVAAMPCIARAPVLTSDDTQAIGGVVTLDDSDDWDDLLPSLEQHCVTIQTDRPSLETCDVELGLCSGSWPYGARRITYQCWERWCQWKLCSPGGLLCIDVGDAWKDDYGCDLASDEFLGCGCTPDWCEPGLLCPYSIPGDVEYQ